MSGVRGRYVAGRLSAPARTGMKFSMKWPPITDIVIANSRSFSGCFSMKRSGVLNPRALTCFISMVYIPMKQYGTTFRHLVAQSKGGRHCSSARHV